MRTRANKIVLIVAAHPDDEVLGCGASTARLVMEGFEVYTLILGEGATSRDDARNRKKRRKEISELRKQAHEANKVLGVKRIFFHDFPDNRFDAVPLLDIVKTIERIKGEIKPAIIFAHHEGDLNIDHRIAYKAVLTATRPLKEETVKEMYSFEVSSSTEWSYPNTFSPNVFFDISETMDIKLNALKAYKSELREYPHPRSLKGIELKAELWGMATGLHYAEAFEAIRIIK